MKNLRQLIPTDSITVNQKKFLDTLFYQSIQNNPLADRLRRCPGCGLYHFVTHRSSDYHNDKCADDDFNLKRKNEAHSLKAGTVDSDKESDFTMNEEKNIAIQPAPESLVASAILPEKQIDIAIQLKNQEILKGLLGTEFEVAITLEQIFSQGFDETAHDVRVKFPHSDLNFCVYGEYCLSWDDTDVVVINLLKHMLWAYT